LGGGRLFAAIILACLAASLPLFSVHASPLPPASTATPNVLQCGAVYYQTLQSQSVTSSGYTLYTRVQAAFDSQTNVYCGLRGESQINQSPYQVGGELKVVLQYGSQSDTATKFPGNAGSGGATTYADTAWHTTTCANASGYFYPSSGGTIGPVNLTNVCHS
jgi:hypothetical protein